MLLTPWFEHCSGNACHCNFLYYKNEQSGIGLWRLQMNQKRSFLTQHLANSENHCYRSLYLQKLVYAKTQKKKKNPLPAKQ